MLNVTLVPILEDNYAYILKSGNQVGIIDAGEADPIIEKLNEMELEPDTVFITHHHWDHVNGNKKLIDKYGCQIFSYDQSKFGDERVKIMKTPGHTKDHVCFYFPDSRVIFTADTIFSMGCGRMFEGTAEEFFESLQKIKSLPNETLIYCGHEYTQANGEFCLCVDPDNQALQNRMNEVRALRQDNKPTIPTTLGQEKETNIFLKAETAEEFAKYRKLKDNF